MESTEGTFREAGQHTAPKADSGVKPYSVLAVDEARIGLMFRAYGTDGVADHMDARSVGDTAQVKPERTGSLTLRRTDRPAVFVFGEKTRDQSLYKPLREQYELTSSVEARFSLSREE